MLPLVNTMECIHSCCYETPKIVIACYKLHILIDWLIDHLFKVIPDSALWSTTYDKIHSHSSDIEKNKQKKRILGIAKM